MDPWYSGLLSGLGLFLLLLALLFCVLSLWRGRGDGGPFNLDSRVIVVTGAAHGIGKEICLEVGRRFTGCVVHGIDVDGEALRRTAEEVKGLGIEFFDHEADISDLLALAKLCKRIRRIEEKNRRYVSVLVNNAFFVRGKIAMDLSLDEFDASLRAGVSAHFCTIREFLPEMMLHNDGMLVTMASLMGNLPGCRLVDYCSAKHALVGMHESIALELNERPKNRVHTLCVLPYMVDTEMFSGAFEHPSLFLTRTFFPTVKTSDLVSKILYAISRREYTLTVPRFVSLGPHLVKLLPVPLMRKLLKLLGGAKGMETFRGCSRKSHVLFSSKAD